MKQEEFIKQLKIVSLVEDGLTATVVIQSHFMLIFTKLGDRFLVNKTETFPYNRRERFWFLANKDETERITNVISLMKKLNIYNKFLEKPLDISDHYHNVKINKYVQTYK